MVDPEAIIATYTEVWRIKYHQLRGARDPESTETLGRVIRRLGILQPRWVTKWDCKGRAVELRIPPVEMGGGVAAPTTGGPGGAPEVIVLLKTLGELSSAWHLPSPFSLSVRYVNAVFERSRAHKWTAPPDDCKCKPCKELQEAYKEALSGKEAQT